jgi:hypothetical protein
MIVYRSRKEKDGIVVEMVVYTNSRVDVGFLLTNKVGRSAYVTVAYRDNFGNQQEWKLACNAGDLYKSTGVLLSFVKPHPGLYCYFDIKSVEFVQPEKPRPQAENPSPKLYEIDSPVYITSRYGDLILTGYKLLWKTGEQKIVPVYTYGQGLLRMFSGSRDYGYYCPIPTVYAVVPPFSGIYQSARIDFEMRIIDWRGSEWGISRYGSVFVRPDGGTISIGPGVDHWNDFPDYFIKDNPVEMYGGQNYNVPSLRDNQSYEITLSNDGKIIYIETQAFLGSVDVYHNDTKIATLPESRAGLKAVIKRDVKVGDRLKFVTNNIPSYAFFATRVVHVTNYRFNLPRAKLKVMCWYSKISTADIAYIQTTCVPEEIIDEYVTWLKGQGYNAVKVTPTGKFR